MIDKEYPYKPAAIELLTLQEVTAAPRVVIGEVDVKKYTRADVHIRFGRLVTSALTAAVNLRIETSPATNGNFWNPIAEFATQLGTSVATEAVSGTVSAGSPTITVTSTTGLVVGDKIYIDNTTVANSEFGRIKTVNVDTSIILEDNLVNAQTGATMFDQAEIYAPGQIDVDAAMRLRVVCDGSGAAQNFAIEVTAQLSH